jgi:hypothetical protein
MKTVSSSCVYRLCWVWLVLISVDLLPAGCFSKKTIAVDGLKFAFIAEPLASRQKLIPSTKEQSRLGIVKQNTGWNFKKQLSSRYFTSTSAFVGRTEGAGDKKGYQRSRSMVTT